MKILVVDDDESIRRTTEEVLIGAGHEVLLADDVAEALRLLEKNQVDFIISDWNMPGLSGMDFLKAVRTEPKTKDIPFVICTSPGADEIHKIESAVGAKVDAYIVKPFRGEVLQKKIEEVLTKKADTEPPGVLIVDDDDQVRKIISEILDLQGHKPVYEARDGDEAFSLLEAHAAEIGLLISDWEMPKMAGIGLLRKIRSDERFAKLPFLMITSQTSIEHLKLKDAINAHVSHYLMKPFSSKDLNSKIDLVMKRSRAERELEMKLHDARQAVQEARIKEARETYREVLRKDPKNIPAHLELAETFLREGPDQSFDEAVVLIKQVIQLRPDSDTGYIALALAFEHAKSLDKAIRILEEALSNAALEANDLIQYHLGRLHFRRAHFDQAVEYLQKSLAARPDFNEAQELLEEAQKKLS